MLKTIHLILYWLTFALIYWNQDETSTKITNSLIKPKEMFYYLISHTFCLLLHNSAIMWHAMIRWLNNSLWVEYKCTNGWTFLTNVWRFTKVFIHFIYCVMDLVYKFLIRLSKIGQICTHASFEIDQLCSKDGKCPTAIWIHDNIITLYVCTYIHGLYAL